MQLVSSSAPGRASQSRRASSEWRRPPGSRVLRRSPQCIVRPTNEEVRRLSPVGAAYASGGSASGYTAPRWVPADTPNRTGHWSMVDSTVSVTAGEVTQVNDLVGTKHLLAIYNGLDEPDDVSSDADLGGRRACQHDYTVNVEDMGAGGGLGDTGSGTVALVFTLDAVNVGDSIFSIYNSTATAYIDVLIGTGPTWRVADSSANSYTGGTPAANTAYLLIFENNAGSSLLKINGSTVVSSMTSLISLGIDDYNLGYENTGGTGAMLSWTETLITSDVMSGTTQANFLAWAQRECGV